MDPFESAFSDRMKHLDTGAKYFIERNADGSTRYRFYATPEMAAEKGADVLDMGFGTFAEETDPMSVGEFAQETGKTLGAMAAGGAAGVAGVPGDVVGLVEGGVQASRAPEGGKLDAFMQGLSQVSERIGSMALAKKFEEFVDSLEVDDQTKQNLKSSFAIGEVAGLPTATAPKAAKTAVKAAANGTE